MYESETYEAVLRRTLARVPDTVSKRPGDIVYDMLSPTSWELSELYFALSFVFDMVFLRTAKGDGLDNWGWQTGLPRNPATVSTYAFIYDGTRPQPGTRFFADAQYLTLTETEDGTLVLESEGTGKSTATILPGTQAVPMVTVRGLSKAQVGQIISPVFKVCNSGYACKVTCH